jgi:hypothetical protein
MLLRQRAPHPRVGGIFARCAYDSPQAGEGARSIDARRAYHGACSGSFVVDHPRQKDAQHTPFPFAAARGEVGVRQLAVRLSATTANSFDRHDPSRLGGAGCLPHVAPREANAPGEHAAAIDRLDIQVAKADDVLADQVVRHGRGIGAAAERLATISTEAVQIFSMAKRVPEANRAPYPARSGGLAVSRETGCRVPGTRVRCRAP